MKSGFKQTEVAIVPEEWIATTVGQMIADGLIEKPLDGNHGNIHPKSSDFVESGIPFVMANNVQGGQVDLVNCSFIRKKQADSLQKGFSKTGDVLLTHKATIGNTAIVGEIPFPYIMLTPQVTYYRVADREKLSNVYLRYYFDSAGFQSVIRTLSGGGTRAYIGISAQHQLPVIIPPNPTEQEAIAEALNDADALIEFLERLLAKKCQLKQGAMQELLTGQKRLPGFSGKWEVRRLGELGSFLKGSGVTKDQTSSGNLPCVRYGELYTRHNDYIKTFHSWISPDVAATATCLRYGDILFAGSGETKEEIGKCVAFVNRHAAYAGGDIVILRTEKADPLFLGYYLNTAPVNRQKASRGQGDAVVHIGAVSLAEIQGVFPSVPEQSAIAAILSDMDDEIAALEAKLAKARQLKQGMMQELLTGMIRLVQPSESGGSRAC
jgi:type I restriction enzyme, S subunit